MNRWARKHTTLNRYDPDAPDKVLLDFPADPATLRFFLLRVAVGRLIHAGRRVRQWFEEGPRLADRIDGWEADRARLSQRRARSAAHFRASEDRLRSQSEDPGRPDPSRPSGPGVPGPASS